MEYPNSRYQTFGQACLAYARRERIPVKECIEIKPSKEYLHVAKSVGKFIKKIEDAHKRAGRSTLVFEEGLEAIA
ncbi:hypothetical protein KA107_00850 [Candidatus Pacearchaeota archaeon]|nr:hypothetical protein [Candidatus Pacearchaeota archaeon]